MFFLRFAQGGALVLAVLNPFIACVNLDRHATSALLQIFIGTPICIGWFFAISLAVRYAKRRDDDE